MSGRLEIVPGVPPPVAADWSAVRGEWESPDGGQAPAVPAGNHRVAVDRVDYPDGSRRVLVECTSVDGCLEGHVEMRPASVAEAVVERLVAEHERTGLWLGGLVETTAGG